MNSTNYYELSQIEPTDKPTWLVMYNSDMLKIDTGIHEAKVAADGAGTAAAAAQSTADTATSNLATLSNTVGNLASELTTAIGNINTINSLIGNGTPTTTDQTLIGAINELHSNEGDLSNLTTTDKTSLVNAINEVVGAHPMDAQVIKVTADGVKNFQTLLIELRDAVDNAIASAGDGAKFITSYIEIPNVGRVIPSKGFTPSNKLERENYFTADIQAASNEATLRNIFMSTNDASITASRMKINTNGTTTITDYTSNVATSGTEFTAEIVRIS